MYIYSRNAEMDKARNLRRGAIRFSNPNKRPHMNKQSGRHKLFGVFTAAIGGGDLKFSEKSKKGKVRSLSAVGKALSSCQMGCHVSEKEEVEAREPSSSSVIATSKRFKVPKNFLNGCNGVHHASVPRKLRSAMKKRNRESMLLDSEKVNHKINGIESPKKNGIKKSKKKQEIGQNLSKREVLSGPITKDEEEVAETLYALAAMFPNKGMNHSKELGGEPMPENTSVLEDLKDNASAAFEASGTAQHASPCPERSPKEARKISSIYETIGHEQLDLPERAESLMASHSTTPIVDLQTMPTMVRSDDSNKGSSHDPELCLAMGQSQILHIERKLDAEFEKVKEVDCKQEQHMLKDQKGNEGLALWPGLSPVASTSQAYVQSSSAAKAPDWLEAAICASKQDLMESCSSSGKTSEVVTHKRPWKRCAAHVHISHIIQSLEVPKRRVIENECHQMKAHEGSKQGFLLEVHNLNGMRRGVTCAPGTGQFATVRNLHESKNGILQKQCYYSGISQAAPTTLEVNGPQKQGSFKDFNFLSFSAGRNNGLKVDNSYDKIGTRSEALSKLQVPYFQSGPQQHGLMSIPTPQSQYSSASYLDRLSAPGPQVRLQQPQYYGNPSCGNNHNSTIINKQQYQSFWAVQLAAQGRSAVNCNIMRTQYPNWQNGWHDYAVSPCAQAKLPRSHASPEALGSKIISISGQQQQLITSIQEKWARPSSPFCT